MSTAAAEAARQKLPSDADIELVAKPTEKEKDAEEDAGEDAVEEGDEDLSDLDSTDDENEVMHNELPIYVHAAFIDISNINSVDGTVLVKMWIEVSA